MPGPKNKNLFFPFTIEELLLGRYKKAEEELTKVRKQLEIASILLNGVSSRVDSAEAEVARYVKSLSDALICKFDADDSNTNQNKAQ